MTIKCEIARGQLNPNDSTDVITLNRGDELQQISVYLDGSHTSSRESHVSLDYGGGNIEQYPTVWELKRVHGGTSEGARMSVTVYNTVSNFYGYYIEFRLELNNSADIVVENGDSSNTIKYECMALYHS